MRKTIDINDAIVKKMKKAAVDLEVDFKKLIEHLVAAGWQAYLADTSILKKAIEKEKQQK
jgi:hypothetical protein